MNITNELDVKLPSYSLSYLINGDDSGLSEEDLGIIDSWYDIILVLAGNMAVIITTLQDDQDPYFSTSPEFGLPCDVVDCKILFI